MNNCLILSGLFLDFFLKELIQMLVFLSALLLIFFVPGYLLTEILFKNEDIFFVISISISSSIAIISTTIVFLVKLFNFQLTFFNIISVIFSICGVLYLGLLIKKKLMVN